MPYRKRGLRKTGSLSGGKASYMSNQRGFSFSIPARIRFRVLKGGKRTKVIQPREPRWAPQSDWHSPERQQHGTRRAALGCSHLQVRSLPNKAQGCSPSLFLCLETSIPKGSCNLVLAKGTKRRRQEGTLESASPYTHAPTGERHPLTAPSGGRHPQITQPVAHTWKKHFLWFPADSQP